MMKFITLLAIFSFVLLGQQTRQERIVICTDAGANDTYTCTPTPAVTSYTTGLKARLFANTANTGAATVNISTLGAKTIKKVASAITTDLSDNDIRAGQYVELVYDGTNFQMLSQLGNAASGGGASSIIVGVMGAVIPQAATRYISPSNTANGTAIGSFNFPAPRTGTVANLAVTTSDGQPASQDLVITLMVNSSPTALVVTVTGGAGAGTFTDYTNTVAVSKGDLLALKLVQGAGASSSAQGRMFSFEIQ